MTVDPSTGLQDGQAVTVTVNPVDDPNATVWIKQCSGEGSSQVCNPQKAIPNDGTQATGSLTVKSRIGDSGPRCDIDAPCYVDALEFWTVEGVFHFSEHTAAISFKAPK